MIKNKVFFIAIVSFLISSCKKDEPPKPENESIVSSGENGIYITNEGNFQFGNASVNYFADGMTNATGDLFQPANNRPLGDVCQSMYAFNNKMYIVVNNSGKIEVVDPNTFVSTATITGFNSPRYFLPVSNSKAYVTDLYSNTISIVNLSGNTIAGTIPCSGWTEELLLAYGKAFVTNQSSDKLFVIDTQNDIITDSITLGKSSNSIVEDKNGKLWVLCSGQQSSGVNATLHRINPISHQIETTFTFSNSTDTPWKLDINGSHDTLYFLNNGLFRMSITDNILPSVAFIGSGGRNYYGIGIHPQNSNIYLADAIDYVQRGKIYIYRPDGTLVNSFLAGIIPGDFLFK